MMNNGTTKTTQKGNAPADRDDGSNWGVRGIVRTEDRVNNKGQMVKQALVDCTPLWMTVADLDDRTKSLIEFCDLTVLGPLGPPPAGAIGHDLHFDVESVEWVIQTLKGAKYILPYHELKARFPDSLFNFYEQLVKGDVKVVKERVVDRNVPFKHLNHFKV